jgi:hypothetical protein
MDGVLKCNDGFVKRGNECVEDEALYYQAYEILAAL